MRPPRLSACPDAFEHGSPASGVGQHHCHEIQQSCYRACISTSPSATEVALPTPPPLQRMTGQAARQRPEAAAPQSPRRFAVLPSLCHLHPGRAAPARAERPSGNRVEGVSEFGRGRSGTRPSPLRTYKPLWMRPAESAAVLG
jgi:hypothetical protein